MEIGKKEMKWCPPRLGICGEPGVGKTTFASNAPGAIFIVTERGCDGVDIVRVPKDTICADWNDVLTAVSVVEAVVEKQPKDVQWVVLDTVDAAETLCAEYICQKNFGGNWESTSGKDGFNAWGRGDKATAQEFKKLLHKLDVLNSKGVGIIMLMHLGLHRSGNALGQDFLKFGGNVNKHTWACILGWADQIGHACREFVVSKLGDEKKAKAIATPKTKDRQLIFDGGPARDAKSRVGYEMPDKIPLNWNIYIKHLKKEA